MTEQQPPQQPPEPSRQELRAERAADKARAKAQRPWYAKKRYIIPLALLALIVFIAMSGGDTETSETPETAADGQDEPADEPTEGGADDPPQDDPPEDEPEPVAGIGDRARDGQFEFRVRRYECGDTEVGGEFLREQAQGVFCKVTLTVKNIGDQSGDFFPSNQYLLTNDDRELAASDDANFAADPDGTWQSINPGNRVRGQVIFDVAERVVDRVVSVRLHDSAFSEGVLVELK